MELSSLFGRLGCWRTLGTSPQRATVSSQSHLHFTAGPHLAWTPIRKTACICTHCANLISQAYFHPAPHLTLTTATRASWALAFLLNKWETEALLEVRGESEQKAIPRAAHAQPPESLVQLAQLPSLDSNLH